MEGKIIAVVLIVLLLGLGFGYVISTVTFENDYSGKFANILYQLANISSQLDGIQTELQDINQNLSNAPKPNPTYNVVSTTQNFSWTNPNTGFGFYNINCSGFSRMFVYATIDEMNPPTGSTTNFWLVQIVWHLYPNSFQQEFTWYLQDVAPNTLNIPVYPTDHFDGTDKRSQGGVLFTTSGQYADLYFAFNSTASVGWAMLTCSIYLRNE